MAKRRKTSNGSAFDDVPIVPEPKPAVLEVAAPVSTDPIGVSVILDSHRTMEITIFNDQVTYSIVYTGNDDLMVQKLIRLPKEKFVEVAQATLDLVASHGG